MRKGYAPPSSMTENITAKEATALTLRSMTSITEPASISIRVRAQSIADTVSFFVFCFIVCTVIFARFSNTV